MNTTPASNDRRPHAVSRLWAFFVLGILITTLAFVVTTWRGLTHATHHRLAIMAVAVGRVEQAYLENTADEMRRLDGILRKTPKPARARALRRYIADHPRDTNAAIIDAHDRVLAAAQPLVIPRATLRHAVPSITTLCLLRHRLCFSPPLTTSHGRRVLFARPFAARETLILERPLSTWPRLRALIQKLPPRFHIFVVNRDGALEYKIPHPARATYAKRRQGALMRALRKAAHQDSGVFSGETQTGWRLGAYQSARYGLIAGVSLPLKNMIQTFAHRLEIPLALIFALLVSATFYYRSSRREIARAEAVQAIADNRIREERLFAEQQRDFYLAVSELNQFIVRHPDPDRLFAETCRIIIAYTGLLFAWIGRVETSGDIRVIAFSEKRPLGVDWLHCVFTADPNRPEGLGTAGRAVQSGHIEITDDLIHDNRFNPWRTMHDQAGTQSAAALPIRTKSGIVAILALGSERLNLFAPPLVRLLEGLAQDLAFSLEDTEREQQLVHQARHDALTGLDNRALFRQKLEEALALPPQQRKGLAVAILDLDGFKGINDQFGHIVGDELLRQIAARLRAAVPANTTAARLGGDEFGLILSPVDEQAQAAATIEAIRWALDSPFVAAGHEQLAIAASIGISLFPGDGDHVDDLIRRADLALYEAKRLGKNVYRFFTPALEERLLNQHKLQHEFVTALRDRIPVLYYQPQVEIATGRLRSLEALLRWPRADGTIWAPGEYFPVIEQDTELMRRLDLYVLDQARTALRHLAREEIRVPIAINIHSRHLLHPDFLKDIQTVLKEDPDVARSLEIEITETSELSDLTLAGEVLGECRALGIAIALDDFGTGYASLNYLQKLPCDILKIDKSFVSDMGEDPRDFAIVSGILTAARVLHLTTVAEGIEQTEQGLLLRDLGCQYGQGYTISKPLPLDAVVHWMHGWRPPGLWTGKRPATTDTASWLARADHKKRLKTVIEALQLARSPVSVTSLVTDACPLHKTLQTLASAPLGILHAHLHHLMTEAMRDHTDGAPTRVATLTQLQAAEEELDTRLLQALAGPDRPVTGL
ncbi:EAL domain-containing protein [Acidiferrobacter sp.]|uniref:putative bifunctional diguanylate cyclase/phosphodiesterase n=1 Tax=Acidiferrobacter sp. TaxID=1872107 RepID=UPI0026202BB7|nr:EAL domain-containing protein [Acidiferrobacter sp.]